MAWAINIALLVTWSLWMMRMGWDKHKNGQKRPQVFFGLGSGDKDAPKSTKGVAGVNSGRVTREPQVDPHGLALVGHVVPGHTRKLI